jgi:putative FmdB family regulatory protein
MDWNPMEERRAMPTYEYRCTACGGRFEASQPITSSPLTECRLCGSTTVERLISSGGGLLFKGSGFHTTDYRSSSYKRQAGKEKPEAVKPATAGKPDPVPPKTPPPSGD